MIQRLEGTPQVTISDRELIPRFDNLGPLPAAKEMASSAGRRGSPKTETAEWGALLKNAGVQRQLDFVLDRCLFLQRDAG